MGQPRPLFRLFSSFLNKIFSSHRPDPIKYFSALLKFQPIREAQIDQATTPIVQNFSVASIEAENYLTGSAQG